MAGWTTHDDYFAEITGGKYATIEGHKRFPSVSIAGNWYTPWDNAGDGHPVGVASPAGGSGTLDAGGTAHTQEAGSIFFANQSPDKKFIISLEAYATASCTLMLADMLVSVSGITLASTGLKNVNSVPLPRYTGTAAHQVRPVIVITTANTTTTPNVNLRYTNDLGTASLQGESMSLSGSSIGVRNVFWLPLERTSRGVRSVQSLDVVTAGTAGECMLQLIRPLAYLPVSQVNQPAKRIFIPPHHHSFIRVYDGASLGLYCYFGGAVTPTVHYRLAVGWG